MPKIKNPENILIFLLTNNSTYVIIYTERTKRGKDMINIRTLQKLQNNDGLTLKNGKIIEYKTGWQVATEGVELTDIKQVRQAIKAYNGNCGIWFAEGIWYIDKSHRVNTKHEALAVGKAHNQISVFGWARKNLAYC